MGALFFFLRELLYKATLSIPWLMSFLGILTFGVMPAFYYAFPQSFSDLGISAMPVSASAYWKVIIPGLSALILGLNIPLPVLNRKRLTNWDSLRKELECSKSKVLIITFIGVIACFLALYLSTAFKLPIHYLVSLLWISSLAGIIIQGWLGWSLFLICFGFMSFQALNSTLIGDIFYWGVLAFLVWASIVKWGLWKIILALGFFLIVILFIVSFKYEYRSIASREDSSMKRVAAFFEVGTKKLSSWQAFSNNPGWRKVYFRLNQGYLTAESIAYVPSKRPFAKGETVKTAIKGAFIPRFLWPDKPKAGGRYMLEQFSSRRLSTGVSMNIGVIGEAYVNYGKYAWVFLLILGLAIKLLFHIWLQFSSYFPLAYCAIPFIFNPILLIETDCLTLFNHLVKATIFFTSLFYILHIVHSYFTESLEKSIN